MVTLVILDGFGISRFKEGNAIKQAGTPFFDKMRELYAYTELEASGEAVGLPAGQMGNSEAGHLTLGAGRPVLQDLMMVNRAIENGEFDTNKELNRAFSYVNETGGTLHLIGLVSDGGVHSHIDHLTTICALAKKRGVSKIVLHAFLDGRDTKIDSGLDFITDFEHKYPNIKIATICGRFYGMDRESNYDRTMAAYDAIMLGQADNYYQSATEAIKDSYANNVYDEFMRPAVIGKPNTICDHDAVIFFNFRSDRMRQLATAITATNFSQFPRKKITEIFSVSLTEYDKELTNIHVAFPQEYVKNTLGEVLSKFGLSQMRIAETTKYAHVTYFFNGGREEAFSGEQRVLIKSIQTDNFATCPQMRAEELCYSTVQAMISCEFDFILVNFSNPDMVGHTADMDATIKAINETEKYAYAIALAALLTGNECVVTADHGNAEQLINKDGSPNTAHTTNKVPFYIVSERAKYQLKKGGTIASVAPTILDLLHLEIPDEMEGSLIESKIIPIDRASKKIQVDEE